ncbi:hypothetical protein C5167_024969 [Papaver somniferum]|uniref:Uncharacterized protein n=1 Tax=Papaver somniferum TaxID=3469 RepID=A0A4Y7JU65_PAPSO|nr:hypothetical protein C5167_024969 [Papaver somniferum]
MESGKITAEEEKFTDPISRYESDILQLLDHWDSFNTDSKIGKYLKELREAYWASEEKCKETANHVRALCTSLAVKRRQFDIPGFRLRIATLIKNLSSLVITPPRRSVGGTRSRGQVTQVRVLEV